MKNLFENSQYWSGSWGSNQFIMMSLQQNHSNPANQLNLWTIFGNILGTLISELMLSTILKHPKLGEKKLNKFSFVSKLY